MLRIIICIISGVSLQTLAWVAEAQPNSVNDGFIPAAFYVPDKEIEGKLSENTIPTELTSNSGLKFSLLPAGQFIMGSQSGDKDESPPRTHRIRSPFYFSKYEVTQGQWENIMRTRPWDGRGYVKVGENFPAVYVNWLEVRDFITRLNKLEGCSCYRLPTEIEWEYAARAGSRSVYSFGNDENRLTEYAWYSKNAMRQRFAHAVGQKSANPWGLYDMHGNVWEWVADWHNEDLGPRIRGGSWGSPASSLRSANRSAAPANHQTSNIGFRIVRNVN